MYFFLLAIIAIALYGMFEIYLYVKKKEPKIGNMEPVTLDVNKLLKVIHKHANFGKNKAIESNKVSKVDLMEAMNLRPAELNHCISKLLDKGLVVIKDNKVAITTFGVQFFKAFSKNDKSNPDS